MWSLHDLRINELGSYIRSRIEAKLLDDGQGWESALAPRNAQNPVGIFSQISSRGLFLGTQIISMLPFIMAIFTKAIDLRSAPFDQVIVGLDIAVIIATFCLAKRGGPINVFD